MNCYCLQLLAIAFFFAIAGSASSDAQELVDATEAVEAPVQEVEEGEDIEQEMVRLGQLNGFGFGDKEFWKRATAAKRFELQQVFAIEIEKIHVVCELDERQRTKLTVASSQAIKQLLVDWRKSSMTDFGGVVIGAEFQDEEGDIDDANAPDDSESAPNDIASSEIVFTDVDEIDEEIFYVISGVFGGGPMGDAGHTQNKFWKKVVASTLTEAQKETLRVERERSDVELQQALTESFVIAVSRQLALTPEQAEKVMELVRPFIGKVSYDGPAIYAPMMSYYEASKIDLEKLKEILSPPQLQQWKFMMVPAKEIGEEFFEE